MKNKYKHIVLLDSDSNESNIAVVRTIEDMAEMKTRIEKALKATFGEISVKEIPTIENMLRSEGDSFQMYEGGEERTIYIEPILIY